MKTTRVVAGALMAAALWTAPALAEHKSAAPGEAPRGGYDVNVSVKLDADGFRLGGRVFAPDGVWGAWLNGRVHDRGFTLDGRVQNPDKGANFTLDADLLDWLLRGWPGRSL